MKKLMFAIGLGLISGSVYAACMGPFCYDDQGAYIGGLINDGNGAAVPVASSTTINTVAPRAVGQEIYCNTCINNGSTSKIEMCVSTGTNVASYVFVSTTTKVCK